MIAIETTILVHAHRPDLPGYDAANQALSTLIASGNKYGLPIHCLVEFSGVVSQPKLWKSPSSAEQIRAQIDAWFEPPTAYILGEEQEFMSLYLDLLRSSGVCGGTVHDARIAACCLYHRVSVLWTADRDFGRFTALDTLNPLII